MSKGFVAFISFVAGAGVGVLATKNYFDKKYADIAKDEIESVKSVFSKRTEEKEAESVKEPNRFEMQKAYCDKDDTRHDDMMDYLSAIDKTNYASKEPKTDDEKIYVISPEEFGELEDYDKISLTLYADNVLADDMNNVINPEETVSLDALNRFGEYEDDAVFVRNDIRRCDYEILADTRSYTDLY